VGDGQSTGYWNLSKKRLVECKRSIEVAIVLLTAPFLCRVELATGRQVAFKIIDLEEV
jgi:hypothetical protein